MKARILAAALALGAAATGAGAFTMEPMTALLAPSGPRSVATFRIKNDGEARIAIRLNVLTRGFTSEGAETNGPAGSLFALYPARLLIEPGATATAKVQWRGPSEAEAERPFRLVAEEVALDTGAATTSGIKVMFRYIASLYVGESRFAPRISADAMGAEGPLGEKGFFIGIANSGTRHVIVLDARIDILDADSPPIRIAGEELGGLDNMNYLPGSARRLFIPREEAQVGKRYDARIEFESDY